MLKIYDKSHNSVGHIVKYKNYKIEHDVTTGMRTLYFTYLARHHDIDLEYYIQNQEDEYVIREKRESDSGTEYVAQLNLEELEGKPWSSFSITDQTIDAAARLALAGTGWTVGECTVTKKRNAGMLRVTSKDIIDKLCTAFMCERVYDTKNKTVSFYKKIGEDRGVYFMSGLNLKKLSATADTYDYYTRIIPIGADGLTIESVNNGLNYLENYQYSSKVKTYIWVDESYTDASALAEDAELKLQDLSKPVISYSADIIDLASKSSVYSILSFRPGDTVTLIDRRTRTRDVQRIVKLIEWPHNREKNSCELANLSLSFEELQQKYREAYDIINTVVASDGRYTGTISVSDILHFEEGLSSSGTIGGLNSSVNTLAGEINAVKLTVGEINTNYISADQADIKYATIENLSATNIEVETIKGDYADFKTVTTDEIVAHQGFIENIQGDLANYKTVIADELTAAKGWMLESSIGNAQIANVSANKLTAGTIDTAVVTIAGTDGRLQIADNTIQINDRNTVRVQIGKDAGGDYSMSVWDASGNLIWDALGATENTIQRKIIRDKMVADDAAIQALKIDFQSFDTALTDQGVAISGTVVQVGSKNLNVALSEHEQAISDNGELLSSHESRIAANESAISLRVTSNEYETYKTTVTQQINSAKSDAISAAASDAATKADAALASSKTYTDGKITTVNSSLTSTNQEISVMKGQIALKVEQTDIDTAVEEIEVGGRNLAQLTNQGTTNWAWSMQAGDYSKMEVDVNGVRACKLARGSTSQSGWSVIEYTSISPSKYEAGTNYTISFDILPSISTGFNISLKEADGTDTLEISSKTVSGLTANSWNRVSVTLTTKLTLPTSRSQYLYLTGMNSAAGVSYTFKNLKIEKGNKATDWSPAPEDADTAIADVDGKFANYSTTIQMNAAITAAKDSITSSVSQTYAKKSDVNTVSGKIATLETWQQEASQKITKDGIIATVGNYYAYETDLQSAESRIASAESRITQNSNSILSNITEIDGLGTRMTSVEQTANGLTVRVGSVETVANAAKKQLYHSASGTNGTAGYVGFCQIMVTGAYANRPILFGLQNRGQQSSNVSFCLANASSTDPSLSHIQKDGGINIWAYKSATSTWILIAQKSEAYDTIYVNEFANQNSGVTVSWINTMYTSLPTSNITEATILAGKVTKESIDAAIELRVEKSGVISSINQTAEAIKINANKVNLTGYVTMTNLSTSGQTTINGANITTGVISAERIAASSIDGTKIVSGAITTDKLAAGAVTAAKINVSDLFSQNITATGTISGVKLSGATGSFTGSVKATSITALNEYYIYDDIGNERKILYASDLSSGGILNVCDDFMMVNICGVGIGTNAIYLGSDSYGFITASPYALSLCTSASSNNGNVFIGYTGTATKYWACQPESDTVMYLGSAAHRWNTIYSKSSAINTSDEREKNIIGAPDHRYEDFFMSLNPIVYQWKYDDDKRLRLGIGAQTAQEKMLNAGLDPSDLSIISCDALDTPDEHGLPDRYGIDYTQIGILNALMTQKNYRRLNDLEYRIGNILGMVSMFETQSESLQYQLEQIFVAISQLDAEIKKIKEAA